VFALLQMQILRSSYNPLKEFYKYLSLTWQKELISGSNGCHACHNYFR